MDYKAQKKLESDRRKARTQFERTEAEIARLEETAAQLNRELTRPEIAADYVRAAALSRQLEECNGQLEALFNQWEQLQERIEELECGQ